MNEIRLSSEVYNAITKNAYESYPNECCGVLLAEKQRDCGITFTDRIEGGTKLQKYEAVPRVENQVMTDNEAAESGVGRHYRIAPLTMYRIEQEADREGFNIAGFYHSHPDAPAVLSEEDKEYMLPGMLYIILSVTDRGCKYLRGYMKRQADEEVCEIIIIREVAV